MLHAKPATLLYSTPVCTAPRGPAGVMHVFSFPGLADFCHLHSGLALHLIAAFLIFFEVISGASGPGVERWQWTLVLGAALEGGRSPAVWLKPGGWVGDRVW